MIEQTVPFTSDIQPHQIVLWFLLGALCLMAAAWQWRLMCSDLRQINEQKLPKRIRGCVFVCLAVAIGVVCDGFLQHTDGMTPTFPWEYVVLSLVALLPFFFLLAIKSYFGPLITLGTVAAIVFSQLNGGNLEAAALIETTIRIAAAFLPDGIREYYFGTYYVYALAMSVVDLRFRWLS